MELQRKLGTTFVIVTHDQEEAMIVADRIAVMNEGRLMQLAEPSDIYERPISRWVAEFLGEVSLIEGRITEDGGAMATALGALRIADSPGAKSGDPVALALRPEKMRMHAERPAADDRNAIAGTVFEIGYRGDTSLYKVRLADHTLMKVALANTAARGVPPFAVDDLVWLSWPPDAGVVLRE
jgi:putrescine transport system ATP-binding protein